MLLYLRWPERTCGALLDASYFHVFYRQCYNSRYRSGRARYIMTFFCFEIFKENIYIKGTRHFTFERSGWCYYNFVSIIVLLSTTINNRLTYLLLIHYQVY